MNLSNFPFIKIILNFLANNYQEPACQPIIEHMIQCCVHWQHLQTVSCSGFSQTSKVATLLPQGKLSNIVNL